MPERKGKTKEIIVALLEKSLKSDAKVEHDVLLPDLTGDGEFRQCDVVVTYGQSPNISRQIIEVQDRIAPMKLLEFDGFITKMETVGAQQLICVTKVPYSKTIINRAKRYGPRAILLTLAEILSEKFPFKSFCKYTLKRKYFPLEIKNYKTETPRDIPNQQFKHDSNDKLYFYNGNLISAMQLAIHYINHTTPYIESGTYEISVDSRKLNHGLLYIHQNIRCPVIVTFKIKLKIVSKNIPMILSEYKRIDEDGVYGWTGTYIGEFEGEPIKDVVTFIPEGNGKYKTTLWVETAHKEKGVSAIISRDKLTQLTKVLE